MPPAKRTRPGRPLVVVLLLLAVLYGAMALGGRYSPALGLDLRGGTTVTLKPTAAPGTKIKSSDLETAKNILANRVNSLGVGNAEVKREGSNIVISVPGKDTQGVLDNIGKTALLSIRQVYESNNPNMTGALVPDTSTPTATVSPVPSVAPGTASPSTSPSGSPSPSATPAPTSPKALGGVGSNVQPAGCIMRAASSRSLKVAFDQRVISVTGGTKPDYRGDNHEKAQAAGSEPAALGRQMLKDLKAGGW